MTPEQEKEFTKAMSDGLDRAARRLLERGFAGLHIDDTNTGKGTFFLTPDGVALSRLLKKYFDVPNVHPQKLNGVDIISVVQALLMSEPPNHSG
jgi:hypothetical protein